MYAGTRTTLVCFYMQYFLLYLHNLTAHSEALYCEERRQFSLTFTQKQYFFNYSDLLSLCLYLWVISNYCQVFHLFLWCHCWLEKFQGFKRQCLCFFWLIKITNKLIKINHNSKHTKMLSSFMFRIFLILITFLKTKN